MDKIVRTISILNRSIQYFMSGHYFLDIQYKFANYALESAPSLPETIVPLPGVRVRHTSAGETQIPQA